MTCDSETEKGHELQKDTLTLQVTEVPLSGTRCRVVRSAQRYMLSLMMQRAYSVYVFPILVKPIR